MFNFRIPSILCLVFLSACSGLASKKNPLEKQKVTYNFTDLSGKFQVIRESGPLKDKKHFYVKTYFVPEHGDEKNIFEKSTVISQLGYFKQKGKSVKVMRPKVSKREIILDGKKYLTQMRLDVKHKRLRIYNKGEGETLTQQESVPFPERGLTCFFSQLVECVRVTNFFTKARHSKKGELKLNIIWDGYPYFNEQYLGLGKKIISSAKFKYEGRASNTLTKYRLEVEKQVIFFQIGQREELAKMFWVSQGLSQVAQQ